MSSNTFVVANRTKVNDADNFQKELKEKNYPGSLVFV